MRYFLIFLLTSFMLNSAIAQQINRVEINPDTCHFISVGIEAQDSTYWLDYCDFRRIIVGDTIQLDISYNKDTNWGANISFERIKLPIPGNGDYFLIITTYLRNLPDSCNFATPADTAFHFLSLNIIDTTCTLSVDEAVPKVELFPNPVADYVFVKGIRIEEMKLFNLAGQAQIVYREGNRIDVSNLPKGVYILRVNGTIQRLIKQ